MNDGRIMHDVKINARGVVSHDSKQTDIAGGPERQSQGERARSARLEFA